MGFFVEDCMLAGVWELFGRFGHGENRAFVREGFGEVVLSVDGVEVMSSLLG
jgi:hypothetical protein